MHISFSRKHLFAFLALIATLGFGMSQMATAAEPLVTDCNVSTKSEVLSVRQVKLCADDAHVALKGRIAESLGDEHYLFVDESGSIEVEIDDKVWKGVEVGPQDLVILEGEVDKDKDELKVDVERVIKQ